MGILIRPPAQRYAKELNAELPKGTLNVIDCARADFIDGVLAICHGVDGTLVAQTSTGRLHSIVPTREGESERLSIDVDEWTTDLKEVVSFPKVSTYRSLYRRNHA